MGADTAIEWCDDTVNGWWGCTAVSPACKNCYAESQAKRWGVGWGPKADRRLRVDGALRELRRLAGRAERAGHKRTVFIASMSDIFEDRADLDEPRDALLAGLRAMGPDCGLIPLMLTKRADRMAAWADANGWPEWWCAGATVEDQERADERIPHLLRVPAAVRFLSCEPLLGPVDLGSVSHGHGFGFGSPLLSDMDGRPAIGWVIAGGESGPKARPSHPDWFRRRRDDCVAAAVPFFFKQWGEWAPPDAVHEAGLVHPGAFEDAEDRLQKHVWRDAPVRETFRRLGKPEPDHQIVTDTEVVRAGKKQTGAHLDGRTWRQTPWNG